jgi:hypothetical protein
VEGFDQLFTGLRRRDVAGIACEQLLTHARLQLAHNLADRGLRCAHVAAARVFVEPAPWRGLRRGTTSRRQDHEHQIDEWRLDQPLNYALVRSVA